METDEVIELIVKAWNYFKKFFVTFVESNFNNWWDFFHFFVLFGCFFVIVILAYLIGYQYGWDAGESIGLIKGFASGTGWNAP